MKKLVFMFAAVAAITFASCGNKAAEAPEVEATETEVVEDSTATEVVEDSTATEVVEDSTATKE